VPPSPWTSNTGHFVDAVQGFICGERLLAGARPPPTTRRNVVAAADITIDTSVACTMAARAAV